MALSFLPSKPNFIFDCTIHRGKDDVIYIYANGYKFILPHARDYCDVVEHLLILQEIFDKGFVLADNISPEP